MSDQEVIDAGHAAQLVEALAPMTARMRRLGDVAGMFREGVLVENLPALLVRIDMLASAVAEFSLEASATTDRVLAERGGLALWLVETGRAARGETTVTPWDAEPDTGGGVAP
jgi:hypothetical protein